jgi:uncharacterized LabA/DUF88 family protein
MPRMNRSEDTYLFVDGEYLHRIYSEAMDSVFGSHGEINFSPIKDLARAKRVFIYDCLDEVRRSGEDDATYNARVAAQEEAFEKFRAPGGIHVRLGSLRGQKRFRQKEVDVLLATDMLTHGYDGNMQRAVLLAGDLDFRPIVDALVRRGVFIEIWYEKKSAAKELPGAADFGMEISFNQLHAWSDPFFQTRCRVPSVSSSFVQPAGATHLPVQEGRWRGRTKVTLFQDQGNGSFLLRAEQSSGVLWAAHEDSTVLTRYFDVVFGTVNWE